jgi:hypothetical protein
MIRMTFLENARNNSYITQENKFEIHIRAACRTPPQSGTEMPQNEVSRMK